MIDFIKVNMSHCLHILDSDLLDFKMTLSDSTGEMDNKMKAYYRGLTFTYFYTHKYSFT